MLPTSPPGSRSRKTRSTAPTYTPSTSPSGSPELEEEHDFTRLQRRAAANSNERRRMESINAGYNMLKSHLPPAFSQGKMSKANILHMSSEYIKTLKQENADLRAHNAELERERGMSGSRSGSTKSDVEEEEELEYEEPEPEPEPLAVPCKKPRIVLYGNGVREVVGVSTSAPWSEESAAHEVGKLVKEVGHLRFLLDIERRRRLEIESLANIEKPKEPEFLLVADGFPGSSPPGDMKSGADEDTSASGTSPENKSLDLIWEAIKHMEGQGQ